MKNKIALITGGLGDIGTAICHQFIQQGAKVIATDFLNQPEAEAWQRQQQSLGFAIEFIHSDVTQFDSCAAMAKTVEAQFGPVDILVNAAGRLNDGSFRKMSEQQWTSIVHTDLDSMFYVTRQLINGMIERRYGRIINIASVSAIKGQFGQTNYSAAKSGIYGFTKSLALEVGKYGITVNAISPGFVDSRMVKTIPEDVRKQLIEQVPVNRLATPEEIAWSIAFLASEQSGYITGINLDVNGGVHMH